LGAGSNVIPQDASAVPSREQADREKRNAALSSVLAAIFLTLMKLVVGILTGSLGILAEALHSTLDLVAAVVTFFAVRVSGRPADREHLYGHGKVENLSALFETLLLLATSAWIIYEAIQRLFFKSVEVEATIWAFAVMIIAIVVDASRSRLLYRVAVKYDSQALEADALHFSTDIWSSSVVIVGLGLVWLSGVLGVPWLAKADAVAAMGVAGIVVWVSLQLGGRTVTALLDGVPASLRDDVVRAARVPGVVEVKRVRVRRSGPEAFADIRLAVQRDASFERTQDIAAAAEAAVGKVLPGADVVVEVEPVRSDHEDLPTTIRLLAARYELGAHGIRIYDMGTGGHATELHLEVRDGLTLDEAHAQATAFEEALREAIPGITEVVTHLEPVGEGTARRAATAADEATVMDVLRHLSEELGVNCQPHSVTLRRDGGELQLSLHCTLDGEIPIADAHTIAERAESLLRSQVPELGRVVIHVEPSAGEAGTRP
jgi:cation diffusion facilitator family transporter